MPQRRGRLFALGVYIARGWCGRHSPLSRYKERLIPFILNHERNPVWCRGGLAKVQVCSTGLHRRAEGGRCQVRREEGAVRVSGWGIGG